jgi:hypothetical protein
MELSALKYSAVELSSLVWSEGYFGMFDLRILIAVIIRAHFFEQLPYGGLKHSLLRAVSINMQMH